MYISVDFALDLLTSSSFVYEPEDLLVYPERIGWLDAYKPSSTYSSTLIQYLIEEGLESMATDSLYNLTRILSYIFVVPWERVRLTSRKQKVVDQEIIDKEKVVDKERMVYK